jgi:2-polyprenyl-3-methyl-5-hydroxy-6-metoxy-1,4-benzoquinol methylase
MTHGAARIAEFFDEYGEREWTRFEDGRSTPTNLLVHREYLHRFVREGDRVLDAGAGPGRFTIELARLGASVVVADVSERQLELNRRFADEAGVAVEERVVADVTDLSRFGDGEFDAVVCYGGPVSYVVERAADAVAELVRVTRPGGHVLLSVMSLVGTFVEQRAVVVELARRDGAELMAEIARTGLLPERPDYGHLRMRLFRWRELRELLERHGEVVAASAAGLLQIVPEEPELRALVERLELELAGEPGALDCGQHILAVLRKPS